MTAHPAQSDPAGKPELPTGQIPLTTPPDRAEPAGVGNILVTVIPMMGSMGVMVFMAMSQGQNTRMLLMAGVMVVAMVTMVGFNVYRQVSTHHRTVGNLRREYLGQLAQVRETVREVASRQRAFTSWYLPHPDALVLIAQDGRRLWEREASAPDVLNVRVGSSSQELSMELVKPELPALANPDVVCHSAMSRFLATHSSLDDVPCGVMLNEFGLVEVCGEPDAARAQVRAMVCHLATFVSPALLRVAVLCAQEHRSPW